MNYVPIMMDRKIIIQRGTPAKNASGGEVLTWSDYKTRWAQVQNFSGDENTTSKKETAFQKVVFTCRYVDGLTEKDRIQYSGMSYDITQIIEEGRRHFHTIHTEYRK